MAERALLYALNFDFAYDHPAKVGWTGPCFDVRVLPCCCGHDFLGACLQATCLSAPVCAAVFFFKLLVVCPCSPFTDIH